jgi:1-acyl-sn-glycerol-3-phosphate acyltransferase
VPPRTILKTASGKIRRAACREAYEQGKLSESNRAPWVQLVRLALRGFATQRVQRARQLGSNFWGVRAVLVALCLAPLLWLTIVLTPGLGRRRRVGAGFVRLAARLAGIHLRVLGPAQRADGPRVYVSNHASYLDVLILVAVLPPEVTFVAKREFQGSKLLGTLFRRLGCIFVERHDMREAVAAAGELRARLRARESLHVFPEGTFWREPGLLPFHMGAFLAAAATGASVVPVAICGTRTMLPDGTALPRSAPLEVIIGEPLIPEDPSWRAAVKLRRMSRMRILAHVVEPDLELGAAGVEPGAAPL